MAATDISSTERDSTMCIAGEARESACGYSEQLRQRGLAACKQTTVNCKHNLGNAAGLAEE